MATRATQVELEGRGTVALTPQNHLATGGEASVYKATDDAIVKIYTDPGKMERDGMVGKVELLRSLGSPTIVAPSGVVVDCRSRKPVGLYMPLAQGEPLPRMFATSYWRRESFTTSHANSLVESMRAVVERAHAYQALLVDGNELNWLVAPGPSPRAIDVDSWQVGRWRATVIMPSIRDWHAREFSELSDWFSFGVVTFQVYTGVHPYRGTLAGYKQGEWEQRMRDNASVFSPGTKLAAAVRPFADIPGPLLEWYEATFQRGERSVPPSPTATAKVARAAVSHHVAVSPGGGELVVDKVLDVAGLLRTWPCGACLVDDGRGGRAVLNVARRARLYTLSDKHAACEVVRVADGFVVCELASGCPRLTHVSDQGLATVLDLRVAGHALFRYDNRLFVASGASLVELAYVKMARPTMAVKRTMSILHPQAVQWFDGVGVERVFEATFVVAPVRQDEFATVRVPELDKLVVLDALAGPRLAIFAVVDRSGGTRRVTVSFSRDYSTYTAKTEDADTAEINSVILPNGVCASIERDGHLVVRAPGGEVRDVADPSLTTETTLGTWGDRVTGISGGVLYTLRTRT
jgi:hypothetical protein